MREPSLQAQGVQFASQGAGLALAVGGLEALLGKARLMEFELIPIGPLSPLQYLLREARKP